jgi:YHS domain-containing protein
MRDPVCGKHLEKSDVKIQSEFLDCTYSFCSNECRKKFEENPRGYLSESSLGA